MSANVRSLNDPLRGFQNVRAHALLKRWSEVTSTGGVIRWSLLGRAGGRRTLMHRGVGCRFAPFAQAMADMAAGSWDAIHLEFDVARHRVISRSEHLVLLPHDEALGLFSLRLRVGSIAKSWTPSTMIADNVGYMRHARATIRGLGIPPELFWRMGGTIETFRTRCFALLAGASDAVEVVRGHRSRIDDPLDAAGLRRLADGLHGWMLRNTNASGRTTYYLKGGDASRPDKNNAIRQFMATIVLHRAARRGLGGDSGIDTARRSLAFNLATFYQERDGIGMIVYRDQAKLGAAALAALAILEQEGRDGPRAAQLFALSAGIERLWQPDGSFRTFHLPPDRNDNQNFYPGEALLFLAELDARHPDPARRDRILRSLAWYRDWHRADPNPAFVPWHTRAALAMHRQTNEPFLAEHVFAMSDWLMAMQPDDVPYPDLRGRFYRPDRPDFGPPHVASTAVFLEGLLPAAALARRLGDVTRLGRYRRAIDKGLRSLREHQYHDALDLALVREPTSFAGGLRTNPFNSDVRVDNVQHALEALLQALEAPELALEPDAMEQAA